MLNLLFSSVCSLGVGCFTIRSDNLMGMQNLSQRKHNAMLAENCRGGGMAFFTLQNVLLTLLALVAGTSFVVQQAVNSNLRMEIGSAWWAGFVSYLGGTLVMLIMVVLMRQPLLSFNSISHSTWWSWTGGLFGAIYIAISILLLPRLGAFTIVQMLSGCSTARTRPVLPPSLQPISAARGMWRCLSSA